MARSQDIEELLVATLADDAIARAFAANPLDPAAARDLVPQLVAILGAAATPADLEIAYRWIVEKFSSVT